MKLSMSNRINKFHILTVIFLYLHISCSSALVQIEVSTNDISFEVNDSSSFEIYLSEPSVDDIHIGFTYSDGNNLVPLPETEVIENGTLPHLRYNVTAYKAGHTTVMVNATPVTEDVSSAFVRVGVFKFGSLKIISDVVGWIYFICWSVSFYPQIINNWKRKSVVGLNFDFLGLNLTGFIAYSIFNIGLRFVTEVKREYHGVHPTGVIPVEINDVVFAVHAVIVTAFTIGQCFVYERGDQVIAKTTVLVLALVWSTAAVFLLLTALDVNKTTPWLTFLYFFSYVKLGVTLTKYIPQAYYNYERKSTAGWSIGTVLFDFVGGLFSIAQMFFIAYNFDDWSSIFGNFTKFGLGVASVAFDVIFMTQHYCLYRTSSTDKSTTSSLQEVLIT